MSSLVMSITLLHIELINLNESKNSSHNKHRRSVSSYAIHKKNIFALVIHDSLLSEIRISTFLYLDPIINW